MCKRVFVLILGAMVLVGMGGRTGVIPRATAQGTTGFGAEREPSIDVDGNDNLYLLVAGATKPSSAMTPGSQIFFMISTDGGNSWNNQPTTRNLSNSPINGIGAIDPCIQVTKTGTTRAYVAYDDDYTGLRRAYFERSKRNTKFKEPIRISEPGLGGFNPRIGIDPNGPVHVVWGDLSSNGRQVVYARSDDLGVTLTNAVNISQSTGDAFFPAIVVDPSGAVDVVWEDTATGVSSIMFSHSTDGGNTFSTGTPISQGPSAANEASIAADRSGGIDVVWVDGDAGDRRVLLSRSTDSGQSFASPIDVSHRSGADIHEPSILTYRDVLAITYTDDSVGQIFFAEGNLTASSFPKSTQVSSAVQANGRAHSPAMVFDSQGKLHIVWIDSSILEHDEGLLLYSATTNGTAFASQQLLLAYP
jgi:hypothetical protein